MNDLDLYKNKVLDFLQNEERFPYFNRLDQITSNDVIRIMIISPAIISCIMNRFERNITTLQCAIEIECLLADSYQSALLAVANSSEKVH